MTLQSNTELYEEAADKNKRYPRYYGIKDTITNAVVGPKGDGLFRYLETRVCVVLFGFIGRERHGLTVYVP